jgi:hypothetical protein
MEYKFVEAFKNPENVGKALRVWYGNATEPVHCLGTSQSRFCRWVVMSK